MNDLSAMPTASKPNNSAEALRQILKEAPIDHPRTQIKLKQLELRNQLWPDISEDDLWLRKKSAGFTTIPRTMPLILGIMDALSKGRPLSMTYLEIWCRAYDECVVVLNRQRELAFSAGFSGQRAEQTWQSRVKLLSELKFLNVRPGPSGPLSYALIMNPYKIVKHWRKQRREGFPEDLYNALVQRAVEIGAADLRE